MVFEIWLSGPTQLLEVRVFRFSILEQTLTDISDHGINERRDVNHEHVRAFNKANWGAFAGYFRLYANAHLHLWMVITHPDFRRRGAGTMLCEWGQDEADKRGGWPLTVLANPMGRAFYQHLGYRIVGSVTAQVDGEHEKVDIDALEKTTAHSSGIRHLVSYLRNELSG